MDNGRLGRLDAYTGDFGRVRYKGANIFNLRFGQHDRRTVE